MAIKIKVKSLDSFNTVIAKSYITKGEIITHISGQPAKKASKYSIQISTTEHLLPYSSDPNDPVSIWRFLNHSCEPNAFIDIEKMNLIAFVDIAENEEVRFNYNTTEFEIASPFNCNCNSLNCNGEIKGFKYLSEYNRKKLGKQIPAYLRKNSV